MKKLIILHGLGASPDKQWYKFVGNHAKNLGYEVFIPKLPTPDTPNLIKTNELVCSLTTIDEDTIFIGHSSGATIVLGILQMLPAGARVKKAILVAGMLDLNLTEYLFTKVKKEQYMNQFPKSWNGKKLRFSCREFIIIHSPNDPYVPIAQAYAITGLTGGEVSVIENAFHFSVSTAGERMKEFPELLKYL
ncbi:MAG: alpha/beta hydrolase [Patescibacteria group bacterium]